MRTNTISLVVIALALLAIGAGFVSGAAGSRPPAVVTYRPQPLASVHARAGADASDIAVDDIFSRDDVVVDRHASASTTWRPARLAIVVGLCGYSVRIESAFLHLGVPLAFDVDPHGADAVRFAHLAQMAKMPFFLHVNDVPSAAMLTSLRARFGTFTGIASRTSAGMARALAGTGFTFFDERGDANPTAFFAARVPFVARDGTVDDRAAESYILFMLQRAADRSEHEGALTLLMRPLPASLAAFESFVQTRSVQIAALTPESTN